MPLVFLQGSNDLNNNAAVVSGNPADGGGFGIRGYDYKLGVGTGA
jgi:hypothetical protein